jgi:hypothetical protein
VIIRELERLADEIEGAANPKNLSCYIAKMLRDHPGSINKWIKKPKPGALVEALKVTNLLTSRCNFQSLSIAQQATVCSGSRAISPMITPFDIYRFVSLFHPGIVTPYPDQSHPPLDLKETYLE